MRMSKKWGLGAALCVAPLATSCIGGVTYDEGGNALPNIAVFAQTCPTCSVSGPQVSSNPDGIWNFDSYNGEPDVSPTNGEEATFFLLCKTLSNCYGMYHRPQWVNYANPGDPPTYGSVAANTYFANTNLGPTDTDGDGLPDVIETGTYGTDPNKKDTDGDGVGDGAEVLGYDWVDYASFGADPLHKDIFVELDYMEYTDGTGLHSWKFGDAIVQKIEAFYNALNVSNPDGTTGFHIHLVQDSVIPQGTRCYTDWLDAGSLFNPRHQAAFHYVATCDNPGSSHPDTDWGGKTSGNPRSWLNGPAPDNNPSNDQTELSVWHYYANFIHEVGHSLGLTHGGGTPIANCKPNYPSVMNYTYEYAFNGDTWNNSTLASTRLQYSAGLLPSLTETTLSEQNPFPGISSSALTYLASPGASWTTQVVGGVTQVDWNRNGSFQSGTISQFIRTSAWAQCPAGSASSTPLLDNDDASQISTLLPSLIAGAGDAGPAEHDGLMNAVRQAGPGAKGLTKALSEYQRTHPPKSASERVEEAKRKLAAKHSALAAQGWDLTGFQCDGTGGPIPEPAP